MNEVTQRLRPLFDSSTTEQVVSVSHQAARAARYAELPPELGPRARDALAAQGIARLFSHQRQVFDLLVGQGANVIVATGTASGKSLSFVLPVLHTFEHDDRTRALFLYPTKALAQDQVRKLTTLRVSGAVPAIYDGDTPPAQRRDIRRHATIVLSNPDMLHVGMLPSHERWAEFLHHLRFVVLDEAHVYRGVFGSHVAQVVRRLRRLCAAYGAAPRFVLATATIGNPGQLAERLVGLPFEVVTDDGAPHPERTVVLWNPPLEDPDLGTRRSSLAEASDILAQAVLRGARAIGFAPTRKSAELVYMYTRRRLEEHTTDRGESAPGDERPELHDEGERPAGGLPGHHAPGGQRHAQGGSPTDAAQATTAGPAHDRAAARSTGPLNPADRIQPYRAGYTPQQRRDIEQRLFAHELDAVVATSALELGIDVGSLDLSLVTGFPGTVTSLRQRWGRAGRLGHGWAVLVAGQDALDQFFMREPERLLSRAVEQAIVDLSNPYILDAHLQAAAYEAPLTAADKQYFGEDGLRRAQSLVQAGRLSQRPAGLAWTQPHSPAAAVSLRTASTEQFLIVEESTGAVLGTMEHERVFRQAHPGAVYLHLGESYLVRSLNLEEHVVLVGAHTGTYYTQAKVDKNVLIAGQSMTRRLNDAASLYFGEIEVAEQVISFQKRDLSDNRVLETVPLNLPEQVFSTEALWLTLAPSLTQSVLAHREAESRDEQAETAEQHRAAESSQASGIHEEQRVVAGSLHAAEHSLIAILPLYAMCDRWDIGGLSTIWHWQTDQATIFIYDGFPGGIGLTRRGYEAFESLAADAATLIRECPCRDGCPSCVQSPKCGNLNNPLDKAGALRLLTSLAPGG
jgi:DEAD/DEAH box helicase domain-containing protein